MQECGSVVHCNEAPASSLVGNPFFVQKGVKTTTQYKDWDFELITNVCKLW